MAVVAPPRPGPSAGPSAAGPSAGPSAGAAPASAPTSGAAPAAASEWERLLAEHFAPVKALAGHLPAEAQQSMQGFERALQATRRVLEVSAAAKAPAGPAELQSLLAPVAEAIGAVSSASEARRVSCPHHLKVLAESVAALSFLAYTGPSCGMAAPRQHVSDCWQSAEFFANKVLMEFRGKDDNQVAWVRGLKAFLQQVGDFVGRNCPSGLRFNPNGQPLPAVMSGSGGAVSTAAAAASSAPQPPAPAARKPGPPPPPPPPGPPPKPLSLEELEKAAGGGGGGAAAGGGMAALFKDISKGEGITSGLRKVTDDMKAKNRPDRTGTVPASTAPSGPAGGAPAAAAPAAKGGPSGTPKLELQGSKWVVEHQVGRQDLVVDNDAPKNSVYVYGCKDCVLQIRGKVNAVSLDKCSKVGLVVGDVISVAEAVNCSSLQMQVTGFVPTLSVEKTDGVQMFVSKKMAADPNFQVVTAKCSAVNVVVLPGEGEGEGAEAEAEADPEEHPVPEQFISTFRNGKLVTVAAAHSGA
ncbi:CAP1 protein [Gonium pectorale]|uniref:CAP1 protein n=1 Tax=Gonium pectorale TaxID=33097 RepID=A0A150FW19_GONPE|nr:CAP1 protein [Gonium pectorale]|eukprot:KXZ41813.1 CAP1 protein [Gonium pectorale]